VTEPRLRTVLLVVAVYHLALGAFQFFAPHAFYVTAGKFPPENHHYIKDTATFYLAFGVGTFVAMRRRSWRVPVLAVITLQYAIHALNHLIDVGKASTDFVGWFDFFALALATLILAALTTVAARVKPEPEAAPEAHEE